MDEYTKLSTDGEAGVVWFAGRSDCVAIFPGRIATQSLNPIIGISIFTSMKIIENEQIPRPLGHYSPVVEHNGILYLSGQLPKLPDGSLPDGIEAQMALVLEKLDHLLTHSGSDRNHVLQVRIYIPDVAYWETVNAIYSDFFGAHRPARCVVPSRELHYGCLVELEAVACTI